MRPGIKKYRVATKVKMISSVMNLVTFCIDGTFELKWTKKFIELILFYAFLHNLEMGRNPLGQFMSFLLEWSKIPL